jgi:hypothetical protein
MTKPTKNDITNKSADEMIAAYHEWRQLKARTEELEADLKAWTLANGDLIVAPSKVWGPEVAVSESVNAEADAFEATVRKLLGDVYDVAVKVSMPKTSLNAACSVIAKRQGTTAKEVQECMWGDLKALGLVVSEHKTVFKERSAAVGNTH